MMLPLHRTVKASAFAIVLLPFMAFGDQPIQGSDNSVGSQVTVVGGPWDSLKLDPKVRIKLSFRNANIDSVIEMLQNASQQTIVKDPSLKGTITVTTAKPVRLNEAFHVFNSVLKLEGFEITRDGEILVIEKFKPPAPPPPAPAANNQPPPQEPYVTIVSWYPLTYANASQVARAINEVFQPFPVNPNQQGNNQQRPPRDGRFLNAQTPPVRASYEEFSNSVIVNAPATQQDEVSDLIKQIDEKQAEPQVTKSYELQYANASDVLPSIVSMLTANVVKGKGWKGNNSLAQQFFGFTSNQNQNLAVADARTNSILVTGTADLIKVADRVIEALDKKIPFAGTTYVFKLENARADTVANLLTAAFGLRQGVQNNNRQTVITPTNNAFNNAATSSRPAIKKELGARPPTGNATPVQGDKTVPVPLQDPNADSGDLLTSVGVSQSLGKPVLGHDPNGKLVSVHDLAGQVTVIADPNTNSIIAVTAPDNVPIIKDILQQLDQRPEQVMIQTVVVEATLDKSKQFGLEWNYAQGKSGTAGQTFGLQTSTTPLQGFSYSLTSGNLSAFFNMLQTDTKFQVLATPRIFTTNNMESQINISQSIPYVTSTIENSNGTFSYNYAFQDVGIVLTVTPHITSNGYVTMDVLQTANDLQGYTSFNAPIVNQRQAETTISAKDGETIILGGMIRNQITSTVNRVPLLGDLPLLGSLFRSTNNDHQKTELLVFLTPTVVRDPAEAKKLRQQTEKELTPETKKMTKGQIKGGN